MKRVKYIVSIVAVGIMAYISACNPYADKAAYQNPSLSFEERVDDLVSRMSLEEKVSQMTNAAAAIDSLEVPEYNWWNECLHGVARMGKATVFPQAIGMAATFDQDHMLRVATAISDEGRAKFNRFQEQGKRGIYQGLTYWTPNINLFRDPRWGRGMETYGEDPYHTGKMAVAFLNGLQGDHPKYLKSVATAKHYIVHSGPEPDRHSFDAIISERDFRDSYLPHFKMTVEEANVYSVMCAYNRYLGEACCGSSTLMMDLLRNELGFEGYVVSDCGAIRDFYTGHFVSDSSADASALGVVSGTDLNCGNQYPALVQAVEAGIITEEEIDVSVKRLMMARMKLGMFDPQDMVPWSTLGYDVVDCQEHRELALETARKSIVLLKNDGILPLKKDAGKIAVIGPNSNDVEVLNANYNGIPVDPVTPLQGIIDKAGQENVIYALGCEHAGNLPVFEAIPASALYVDKELSDRGLQASYYDNSRCEGEPVHQQIDPEVDFYWWDQAPMEDLDDDNFGVIWEGYLVPPVSGRYAIGGEGMNNFSLEFDNVPLVNSRNIHHANKRYEFVELKEGEPYKIHIRYGETHGDASMILLWAPPAPDLEKEAMQAVEEAERVIMFMGLSPRLEGEEMRVEVEGFSGGDREILDLPDIQQDLIKKVMASGKPVVLVLLNGSALSINWEQENVPAIIEAWYGGQAAGTAIADVLFGDYNPAGRLPITFYKSVEDLPPFGDYNMAGRTYRYFEGEALYAFGYGLSYTEYSYGDAVLDKNEIKADESLEVSVEVRNAGQMAGEEVVQLYIRDDESTEIRPLRELKAFTRIYLEPGESKTVSFTLSPDELSFYNLEKLEYEVEQGSFTIFTGGSSRLQDLKTTQLKVTGS